MKPIKTSVSVFLMILGLSFSSFTSDDMKSTVDQINAALKSGNSDSFISFIADPVDLTLPGSDDSYSKAQASVILKKFFAANKVKTYTQKQTGKSVDDAVFIIGTYEATNGKIFRMYVLIKTVGGKNKIQFVEFEEE